MARIIRGALLQAAYTGDPESMLQKNEAYARDAAKQGAQIMCFQELFCGPYFCQEQNAIMVRPSRTDPRWSHGQAHAEPSRRDQDGFDRSYV